MASLAEVRVQITDSLNELDGITAYSRPIANPRVLDGWVVITRVIPSDYSRSLATFTVVVSLGTDIASAEELFEVHTVKLINALTEAESFNATNVSAQAEVLIAGGTTTPVYLIAITMTAEVD